MSAPERPQPTLHTARLRLVPLSPEHLEHLVLLDADPEVMRFVGKGKARPREDVVEHFRGWLARAEPVPGLGLWAGFLRSELLTAAAAAAAEAEDPAGSFVGWWTLQPPKRSDQGALHGQAELGYRLLRRFWRQGLAKEGAAELVRYGFEDRQLRRIFAETMAINAASRATMASVGLGYKRTFYLDFGEDTIPGSDAGEVEYELTREDWESRQPSR